MMSNKNMYSMCHFSQSISISSQVHANPNPGQLWMSYSNGFAGSSPKFAAIAVLANI
jgi:hypothetical protein